MASTNRSGYLLTSTNAPTYLDLRNILYDIQAISSGGAESTNDITDDSNYAEANLTDTLNTIKTNAEQTQSDLQGVEAFLQYNVYRALLTQAGTSNPTVTVLQNTLGGTVTVTREDRGSYLISSTDLFTINKTGVNVSPIANDAYNGFAILGVAGSSIINLSTFDIDSGSLQDDMLVNTLIEIYVYP